MTRIPIQVTLPWAVLVSDNARHSLMRRQRRIILTPKYREALAAARHVARNQYRGLPLRGDVRLQVIFHFPDKRRRDMTNLMKLVQDALTGIAYDDDSQIAVLHLLRCFPHQKFQPGAQIIARRALGLSPDRGDRE